MPRFVRVLLLIATLPGACTKPSLPATMEEKRLESDTSCRDSHVLFIDGCKWWRVDAESKRGELIAIDPDYCANYDSGALDGGGQDIKAHPSEPRAFAHLKPDVEGKPEVVREISMSEGRIRTIAVPLGTTIEFSGYDKRGDVTVLVGEAVPERSATMQRVQELLGRESCEQNRARALSFDGSQWTESAYLDGACDDGAPTGELASRLLAPSTTRGVSTLVELPRVDRAILDRLEPLLAGDETLRVRGNFLLTTTKPAENAHIFDLRTGALLWKAPSFSATAFWPCP